MLLSDASHLAFSPRGHARSRCRRGIQVPAGGSARSGNALECRVLRAALIVGERAARMERAALRRRARAGPDGVLGSGAQRPSEVVGIGRRRDQELGIRMRGLLGQLLGRSALDDVARVHDQHLVGEVPGRRDVVGDVEQREPEVAPQLVEQAQHLQPDRDVEHGNRLVGQQHGGPRRQRPGEGDPLPLSAGQLVRVLAEVLPGRRQVHPLKQIADLGRDLRLGMGALVQPDRDGRGGAARSVPG